MANGTRSEVLSLAASQIGVHEYPYGSNHVKYCDWYGLTGPWCDMFVSWVAHYAGADSSIGKFAYTPSHANWFRSKNRWHASYPQVGDLAFYDFGLGRISHVGFVEKVPGDGYIYTIEGNTDTNGGRTGGQVMRKKRPINNLIVGYGRPAYSSAPAPKPTPKPSSEKSKVMAWQKLLEVTVDGDWGKQTDTWGLMMRRASRRYTTVTRYTPAVPEKLVQKVIDVDTDGVFGPLSKAALRSWVAQVQRLLRVSADGSWGPKTDAAFLAFRNKNLNT